MVVQPLVYALLEAHEVDRYVIVDFTLFCGIVGTRSFALGGVACLFGFTRCPELRIRVGQVKAGDEVGTSKTCGYEAAEREIATRYLAGHGSSSCSLIAKIVGSHGISRSCM